MVSWDWGIQLPGKCGQLEPKDTINRWVRPVVAEDTINKWAQFARTGSYFNQVNMVRWDWGIQLPCSYCQLGLEDTITRWVQSVEASGYNHQVSTINCGSGYNQKVVQSARAMGNNYIVSMVSWDRRIQLPSEYYQVGLGDTITR